MMGIAARVPLLAPRALLPASVHRRHAFGENPDPAAVKATARQIGRTPFATTGRYFTSISEHDDATVRRKKRSLVQDDEDHRPTERATDSE